MPELDRRTWLKLLAAYALFTVIFTFGVGSYARLLAPVLVGTFDLVQGDFSADTVTVSEKQLLIAGTLTPDGMLGERHGGDRAEMTVELTSLAVCPVLVLTLLCAWPVRSRWARAASLALGCLFLVALTTVEAAQVVTSEMAESLLHQPPTWTSFLFTNGGSKLLALLAASAALWLGGRIPTWLGSLFELATAPATVELAASAAAPSSKAKRRPAKRRGKR